MGACPPEWRVGPWQNCTRDCGGGVSWRIVTCLKTFEGGTQQLVRDSECKSVRPSSRKSCNGYICPTWYAGQWSVCSVSCGTGTQEREVVCRHIGDTFCRDTDKPRTIKNCTTGIPCYNMNGDIQERNIGEFQGGPETNRPQGDQAVTKEDLYQPRFVTTTWDSCSASCGEGVRFRFVRCKVFLQYLNDFADLPDSDCLENEEKPEKFQSCMIEPCYDQYERIPAGMTECSKTCLGGIQETILKCVLKENKTEVDDSFCLEAPHVQTERRVCNVKPCPQRWELGEYGECSASCGVGVRTRSVKCIQEFATVFVLPDVMCNQPIPDRTEKCNTHSCPAAWSVGNWSECSVTCGRGVLLRKPQCQRQHDGEIITVSVKECDIKLKPETEKSCIMEECPQAMIKTKDMQFFQLNKMKKLKLVVGMEAHVLPETNIIIKCPHVGLDRQKITWFKNGYKFRRSKRARMSRSGALRIKHARLGKDEGVYSCLVGGLEANVSIAFRTSYSVLQDTVIREKYQRGAKFPGTNLMNGTFQLMDPVARKMRPLTLIGGDWSRCSVSCGGGLQSRNVSCEIITEDYYEVLPKSDCYNQLEMPPLTIQSCGSDPCVTWKAGNWSECSETECVRNQYSIQRRTVECVNEFNDSVTDDKFCRGLGFPPDNIRDCVNMNCTARWNTSKWSECNAECNQTGYKTRMLNCIWANTGQMATAGSCGYQRKPQVTKKCSGKSCSEMECKDESEYCSIVRMMNMCNMENYQVRCCWTCNDEYYYYDSYEDYGDEDVVDEADIS